MLRKSFSVEEILKRTKSSYKNYISKRASLCALEHGKVVLETNRSLKQFSTLLENAYNEKVQYCR